MRFVRWIPFLSLLIFLTLSSILETFILFIRRKPIQKLLNHNTEKGNDVKERRRTEGWIICCFIIASGLVLFFNLWNKSLENHDYLRYAEVAREMIRSGDWIIPHLNGEIFLDKPPLLFWLIAIPSSVYGSVTPFIARLPSALSAWIGVIILFFWGKRIYGKTQSGLIAGGSSSPVISIFPRQGWPKQIWSFAFYPPLPLLLLSRIS